MTDKPWKPGDPIANGAARFERTADRRAYGLENLAQLIVKTPGLDRRRQLIAGANENDRDALKARVKELWKGMSDAG